MVEEGPGSTRGSAPSCWPALLRGPPGAGAPASAGISLRRRPANLFGKGGRHGALGAKEIERLGTENAFSLGVDIQRVVDRGMDVVRLNIGEPDVDSPSHINRVGAEQILAGNAHYTDPAGDSGSPARARSRPT